MEMECFSFHRNNICSAYSYAVYFKYTVYILNYSEVSLKKFTNYAMLPCLKIAVTLKQNF